MLVALEKALLSLTDQIPKDQQKSAGKVGWLLLTSLKLQHHEMLAWEAKIHELQQVKEALEVWVHVLEKEVTSLEQGGLGELELEDGSEDSFNAGVVAPALQVQPIVKGIWSTIANGPRRWGSRAPLTSPP